MSVYIGQKYPFYNLLYFTFVFNAGVTYCEVVFTLIQHFIGYPSGFKMIKIIVITNKYNFSFFIYIYK